MCDPVSNLLSQSVAFLFGGAFALIAAMVAVCMTHDWGRNKKKSIRDLTLQERYDIFKKTVKPGAIFINEYKRRCKIIREDVDFSAVTSIEDGPWYRILVYWDNHEPTEITSLWWQIGIKK